MSRVNRGPDNRGDARAPGGFDVERFCRKALREGLNGSLGLRYVSHDATHVELLLELPRSAQAGGDGPVMALLDMAGTLSVWAATGTFRPHATLDMRIDHLRPAAPGAALHGRAGCHCIDGRVASVRGTARTAAGDEIAALAATYVFTDPS